jgi:transposase
MKKISVVGIDLAKEVFHIHGTDEKGKVVLKKKLRRSQLKGFMVQLEPCLIGMEACGSAHYWARVFKKMGHEVKLMSPQFVKPYVKSNKNDSADAEAIAEAVMRPNMRFVSMKGVVHQDIQSVHRIRQRLIRSRTALSNEIRGLLQEYGIVVAKGFSSLKKKMPLILEDANNELSPMTREIFSELIEELKEIEKQIKKYDQKIEQIFKSHEVCERLEKIEGLGPITATALVSAVPNPQAFKNGREFSAWLGLVPRQHSTGGKPTLLGISKRGDRYLRTLFIHGARSVVKNVKRNAKGSSSEDSLTRRKKWILEKEQTRGYNKACVALANKNARIAWSLMKSGEEYKAA